MNKKYEKDFPEHDTFNWKTVRLITPENVYYGNHQIIGVLLHDGRFVTNGVFFEPNQFEVIDEDPLNIIPKEVKQEERVKEIANQAWKDCANAHRLYPDNKHTFTEYWESAKDQYESFIKKMKV
jgi:hypothetical protein